MAAGSWPDTPQAVPAAQESWEALPRARSGGEEGRGKRGRVCPGPGELLGPPAPRVASPHPLGVSSLSSQGQQRLQLYSLGRLEPGREAPPELGTWHRVPGTRGASVCISGCPHQEPQRQSLCSPLAPAGRAPQLWASKPPQLFQDAFLLAPPSFGVAQQRLKPVLGLAFPPLLGDSEQVREPLRISRSPC